jgi:hypothetical protein
MRSETEAHFLYSVNYWALATGHTEIGIKRGRQVAGHIEKEYRRG